MSTFDVTRAIRFGVVAVIAAAVACPASAASDHLGGFGPANSPEETIYRPECRIVQGDGTWLPCRPVESD